VQGLDSAGDYFTIAAAQPPINIGETTILSGDDSGNGDTANVVTPVSLPAGNYWLAYLPSSNSLHFAANFSIGSYKYANFTFGPMPATFPAVAGQGVTHWAVYGTLQP
jgi:hypothetical protein